MMPSTAMYTQTKKWLHGVRSNKDVNVWFSIGAKCLGEKLAKEEGNVTEITRDVSEGAWPPLNR